MKSISISWKAEADEPVVFATLEIQIEPGTWELEILGNRFARRLVKTDSQKLSCLIDKDNCQFLAHKQT